MGEVAQAPCDVVADLHLHSGLAEMIVEDNELNMKLFRDLLEAHGYHTVGTRDASMRSISRASTVPIWF
jgi:hypothetical protein